MKRVSCGWTGTILMVALAAAGCSEPQNAGGAAPVAEVAPPPPAAAVAPATPPPAGPLPAAPLPPAGQAVNDAVFGGPPAPAGQHDPVLVKAQVLLDRARFSPGPIDGRDGSNMRLAVAGFERARNLPEDGVLDEAVWQALTTADTGPALQAYAITADDLAGPFLGEVPDDMEALSKLERVGYAHPAEALAEKFHMDEKLLRALNPEADFATPGATIVVAAPRSQDLGVEVASIEVDKAARAVRAYDPQGRLVGLYPASVGSSDLPAPSGVWAVRTVAPDAAYYYDPTRLNFGQKEAKGKLKIAPGPNNPVGAVWIDLTKDTYGIHGSPDPETVGKQQSHGCVRLTNWDAVELGKAVKAGTKVAFTGATGARRQPPTKT
jgi:lipoprotein-anchoring transpeptidase ErfK/SrfK